MSNQPEEENTDKNLTDPGAFRLSDRLIEGDPMNNYTPIESLGNLKEVGGKLDLRSTSIESLGNLKEVGGRLEKEQLEELIRKIR